MLIFIIYLNKLKTFLKILVKQRHKKHFTSLKKVKRLKKLDELEEKATDLLHSDMIGTEVLQQISLIAKPNSNQYDNSK